MYSNTLLESKVFNERRHKDTPEPHYSMLSAEMGAVTRLELLYGVADIDVL